MVSWRALMRGGNLSKRRPSNTASAKGCQRGTTSRPFLSTAKKSFRHTLFTTVRVLACVDWDSGYLPCPAPRFATRQSVLVIRMTWSRTFSVGVQAKVPGKYGGYLTTGRDRIRAIRTVSRALNLKVPNDLLLLEIHLLAIGMDS